MSHISLDRFDNGNVTCPDPIRVNESFYIYITYGYGSILQDWSPLRKSHIWRYHETDRRLSMRHVKSINAPNPILKLRHIIHEYV